MKVFLGVILFMSVVRVAFDLGRGIYPKDNVERFLGILAATVNGAIAVWVIILLWRMT